jgi:hypothetical protein
MLVCIIQGRRAAAFAAGAVWDAELTLGVRRRWVGAALAPESMNNPRYFRRSGLIVQDLLCAELQVKSGSIGHQRRLRQMKASQDTRAVCELQILQCGQLQAKRVREEVKR